MRSLFILSFIFIFHPVTADETLWTELNPSYQLRTSHSNSHQPHTARKMHLDINKLKQSLSATSRGIQKTLYLPTTNGELINFRVVPTSVMSPALAARYPDIQTWKITSITNPEITGRIDIGPLGFHGLFYTDDGDRIFIDPEYQKGTPQTKIYTVQSHRNNHGSTNTNFTCELHGKELMTGLAAKVLENPSDDVRTYRLALATTGEYTQLFGGTKDYALAGITKTVNRLNQVFERDLNIHLELVAENDKLIFLSPTDDPYSNQNASEMAKENIVTTNDLIGIDNYDIGHVLGTGSTGGLAFISATCGNTKAGGVSGSNSPEGDAFNIDYVAHEIGHQLGATHTFNGYQQNCSANNRTEESAVEPGSGSSIMSYAGICGGDNLQANSNAFFHSTSIAQIRNFTRSAAGAECGVLTASINNNPQVNAGKNYTIPAGTPFVLTGNTSDPDGDKLLHSWEQTDVGAPSDLYSDMIDNPLFRIWNPTTSTARYFPRLGDLLSNRPVVGELLPTTDRQLNFSLLVRDNKGGLATDSIILNVIAGTPFAITSNSIPTFLNPRESFNLTWDVASTSRAPINCPSVNIGFIQADASYLPILSNTPNDGSESVTLPADIASITNANIKVACSNNIFFATSQSQHTVNGDQPVLSLSAPSTTKDMDGNNVFTYTAQLSIPAPEEISISYQLTDTASQSIVFQGEVVIPMSRISTSIKIPSESVTTSTQLIIEKPDNAQFETAASQLFVQTPPVTTDAAPTPSSTGGGGSPPPFATLILFLLVLIRFGAMRPIIPTKSTT